MFSTLMSFCHISTFCACLRNFHLLHAMTSSYEPLSSEAKMHSPDHKSFSNEGRNTPTSALKTARSPQGGSSFSSPRRVTFNKLSNDVQLFDLEKPVTEIRRTNSDNSEHYAALRKGFIESKAERKKNPTSSPLRTSMSDEFRTLEMFLSHHTSPLAMNVLPEEAAIPFGLRAMSDPLPTSQLATQGRGHSHHVLPAHKKAPISTSQRVSLV